MLNIVLLLAVLATLLVVVAVSQPVAVRLRVAPVVLLAVIGVAIGAVSIVLVHAPLSARFGDFAGLFANLPVGAETFIYVFLPLLVFESAITVDVRRMLEDAAPILMLAVIVSGQQPNLLVGEEQFLVSFFGGAVLGLLAGRALLQLVPWTRDDRLAEATLTVALPYLVFIVAEQVAHVSGVVAVLCAGLTVSAFGRSLITPYNWSFIRDLWAQIAFWAHSLVFVLASILVPKLLLDMQFHDVVLLAALIVAVFAARILVLFLLLPLLSLAKLTEPISTAYKLAIAWGGLRGALTLVLALAVTENPTLKPEIQRFVAVLATGLVLFTLLVNGTTLRIVIRLLRLDRLSPVDQALRDRVLALSYTEVAETIRSTANEHEISPLAVTSALAPYEAGMGAAKSPGAAEASLTDHQRLAIGLVALGNQERMLALEIMAEGAPSPITVHAVFGNTEALGEGARSGGRLGYQRAAEAALAFPFSFAVAYFFYRRFGVVRFLADPLRERLDMLLVTRLLIQELTGAHAVRSRSIFGERVVELIDVILKVRLKRTTAALDALRRQYPQYAAALEARFLRQSAMRREMGRYDALFQEGLIAAEVYEDLKGSVEDRKREARPRFDLGLDTRELIGRLDLFAGLNDQQLERVQKLLRARFVAPRETIVREGDEGDACYFIASGAAEVVFPGRRIPLGSGDLVGEMALLTGMTRQADVVAMTYCRLLVLRKVDFDRFMEDNRDIRLVIHTIAASRSSMNRSDETRAGLA